MRRIAFGVLILSLLALPAAAQVRSASSCAKAALAASPLDPRAATYQPLAAGERLFYGLSGLDRQLLEVQYLVKGAPYLTETVDLAAVKLPQAKPADRQLASESDGTLDFRRLFEGERILELLALRPDLVRQLHEIDGRGGPVEIKVFQAGRLVETVPFQELVRRSAELRESPAQSVLAFSKVQGPGDSRKPRPTVTAKTYLPDCGDCTTSTPCDTECGWDPGKGGPVTCGEYGVCVGYGCSCEVSSYSWSSWYVNRVYAASPATYDCLNSRWGGSTYHQLFITEYRRDRIQYSWICPNCPECTGCYSQEQVVSYEYGYGSCFYEVGGGCGFGRRPGCYELCEVYYNTPCN